MNRETSDKFNTTESALRDNIISRSASNLELCYHPQIELRTGCIAAFEVLLRRQANGFQGISPDYFIPLPEENDTITSMAEWVIDEACRQFSMWRVIRAIPAGCRLCLNVSPRQYEDPAMGGTLEAVLRRYGIDGKLLELEITESMPLSNNAHTRQNMAQLRKLGVRMSIDDFGTGYVNLAYLKHYAFHCLKIDRSLIQGLVAGDVVQAIVDSILQLAHRLDLKVVAEGVETSAQLSILQSMGCDLAQGHLFTRPLPAPSVPAYIRRWQALISPMFQRKKRR